MGRGMRALMAVALLGAFAAGAIGQEQHKAKSALDDRADPNAQLGEVGKGTHMARQPLKPGAYFNNKARDAVKAYYAAHPPKSAEPARWQIGEALPAGAGAVPPDLVGKLPKLPPGHRYVTLGSDVLLVASGSKMVVDGIAYPPR